MPWNILCLKLMIEIVGQPAFCQLGLVVVSDGCMRALILYRCEIQVLAGMCLEDCGWIQVILPDVATFPMCLGALKHVQKWIIM